MNGYETTSFRDRIIWMGFFNLILLHPDDFSANKCFDFVRTVFTNVLHASF